ncbi:MAG: class I SAM-dependent methyltransferase [Pseudomonadota bacterium]
MVGADRGAMLDRGRRRSLSFGLQTVLGLRKRGFFIPLRMAEDAARSAVHPYGALEAVFEAATPHFEAHLARISAYADDLEKLKGPPPEPRFDQAWFPRLDAAALYTAVRDLKPARIVEVGSGHSTRFLARAVKDGGLNTQITAIDPKPRADLGGLPITLVRTPLQSAPLDAFHALRAGDLLFVDSSHVLMPGTDLDVILNRVLPKLPSGITLGFHDIFLPDPYPDAWPFTAYNEQNALAAILRAAELLFASHYVTTRTADAVRGAWPSAPALKDGARESLLLVRLRT